VKVTGTPQLLNRKENKDGEKRVDDVKDCMVRGSIKDSAHNMSVVKQTTKSSRQPKEPGATLDGTRYSQASR